MSFPALPDTTACHCPLATESVTTETPPVAVKVPVGQATGGGTVVVGSVVVETGAAAVADPGDRAGVSMDRVAMGADGGVVRGVGVTTGGESAFESAPPANESVPMTARRSNTAAVTHAQRHWPALLTHQAQARVGTGGRDAGCPCPADRRNGHGGLRPSAGSG